MKSLAPGLERGKADALFVASECVSEHGKGQCTALGGECVTERDGYYIVSTICIVLGITIFLTFTRPTALALQGNVVH